MRRFSWLNLVSRSISHPIDTASDQGAHIRGVSGYANEGDLQFSFDEKTSDVGDKTVPAHTDNKISTSFNETCEIRLENLNERYPGSSYHPNVGLL